MTPDGTRFDQELNTYSGELEWRCHVGIRLRRVSDGFEVERHDIGYPADHDGDTSGVLYIWTEGNWACDCNRHLDFERALGNEPDLDDMQCSHGRYKVVAPQWLADACERVERFVGDMVSSASKFGTVTAVDVENGVVTVSWEEP